MKISSVIIAGSAVANVVLVSAVLIGVVRPSPPESDTARVTREPVVSAAPTARDAANAWSELQSDNLKEQADKLSADGFPPTMIRAIITARIRAGFAAQRKAIEAQGERPFWQQAGQDPATQAALRALMLEEQKAIKDLLGPDPINGPEAALRRQFPQFSEETIAQLAAIRERYDQQRMELYSGNRGMGGLLPDEQAKNEALEKAMRAEIRSVLSPADLEDYELRTSNTANQLRYELVAFNANEQEFRTLYKLKSAFDEQYGINRGGMTEEQMRARSEGQKQHVEQIKIALGLERFAEYQRATDYNYRQTTQLVARLNLPSDTANTLYTIQKDFEQRRNDLYRGGGARPGSPEWDTLAQQASALQQQAIARITPVLGTAQHVEAYKQYGGSWLSNMVPRPPRAPARGTAPTPPTKS